MSAAFLAALILVMTVATQLTRFLPFWLPAAWLETRVVHRLRRGLPSVILLLLVVYCVKDTRVLAQPWGIPQAVSLGVVILLHVWKRNALLSIFSGTAVFMVFQQVIWPG